MNYEPTVIIYSIVAACQAVQQEVLSVPSWLHVVLIAVIAAGGAIINRSRVTPV